MALAIRLSRGGRKNRPFYRIVVADKRMPRDGRYIERLGTYNPLLNDNDENRVKLVEDRLKYWLSQGAKPSERVALFLGKAGLIDMPAQPDRPNKAKQSEKTLLRIEDKKEKQAEAAETAKAAAEDAKAAEEAGKAAAEEAAAAPAEEPKTEGTAAAAETPVAEDKAAPETDSAPAEEPKAEEKPEEVKSENKPEEVKSEETAEKSAPAEEAKAEEAPKAEKSEETPAEEEKKED